MAKRQAVAGAVLMFAILGPTASLPLHGRGGPWLAVVPIATWLVLMAVAAIRVARPAVGGRPAWRRPSAAHVAILGPFTVAMPLVLGVFATEFVPLDPSLPRNAVGLADAGWPESIDLLEAFAVGGGAWLVFFAPYYAWARSAGPAVRAAMLRGRLRELAAGVPRRGTLVRSALCGILLVPVAEEFAYRGVLVVMAGDWTGAPWIAAIASLVLFVAAHATYGAKALWLIAPFGAVATLLVLSPWGLPAAVAFHACNNLNAYATLPRVPRLVRACRAAARAARLAATARTGA